MELFKRYVAASSMGVVALVCVLVGLLGVTVLRPPTHQVSSVVSPTDLIMTRGNVLSIVKDDVTVTATSKSGAPVTLSIGTTQDVKGWIGDAAYTEVIGVESDRTKLKAESHDAIGPSRVPSPTPAQSGAQSGVQSGAQPLAEPSSADLVQQLASSDMWFKQASGEGTVSLDLENVPSGRSALAASAAGPDDLTLTLTWKVEQTNTLAIIAFLAACVFALIALALFLTRWQLLRLRKIREARIEERRKADSLETSSINSAAVKEPGIITACADAFGSQAVIVAIDAKQVGNTDKWEVYLAGGRIPTGIDAVAWAEEAARRGAGEILLTSMDRDGTKDGFDIPLTRAVARAVPIPVIASGGVGTLEHFAEGIIEGEADAVLAASVFHFGTYSIRQVKEYMASQGIPVRLDF